MRRGRDRARDLLGDDVALVREPEPFGPERLAELADRGRRPDDDAPRIGIERLDPRQLREIEQEAVRDDDRRERVAGRGDADAEPVAHRSGDELADLVFAFRRRGPRRFAALVPDPVPPHPRETISRLGRRTKPYHRPVDAPLLVVVTGMPSSGKTTIATALAERLRLPLVAKDDLKESLFETLGPGDVAWSGRLGDAAYDLMFALARTMLAARVPLIVEANFFAGQATRFITLPEHRLVQIHCDAPLACCSSAMPRASATRDTTTARSSKSCRHGTRAERTLRWTCPARPFGSTPPSPSTSRRGQSLPL